jgi:phage portal protein BeeE
MDQDDAKNVQNSLDQKIGGPRNAGRISVTNKDLSYIPLVMNATDLQLVNSGIVTLRSICNVFGLDSSLFNDPDNKTYNNRTEAEKAFYTNAIMPLSQKVGEWLTGYLGKNLFPGKTIRIRQDFTDIECLQESFNIKARTYVSLVQAGIMTPQTAAEWLGIENKTPNNDR